MASDWDFERYEAYLGRLSDDMRLPLMRSAEDASGGWGLRPLTRSEFAALAKQAEDDAELRERWLRRLEIRYDRERASLTQEIEDGFADLPYSDELASGKKVGTAA